MAISLISVWHASEILGSSFNPLRVHCAWFRLGRVNSLKSLGAPVQLCSNTLRQF